jgi:hypothetical protein
MPKWPFRGTRIVQTLIIHRNRVDINHCPVVSIMVWMKVLDAKCPGENGPLFPALDASHHDFLRDGEGKTMRICESTWNLSYVGMGLAGCTMHSIRRSVVKWAARCGAGMADVIGAGRWVNDSKPFLKYWKDGTARRPIQEAN